MGNHPLQYSVPIGEKREGESHVYRHPAAVNGFLDNFNGQKTVQGLFMQAVKQFPNNRLLGTQVVTGENSKHYVYKTYKQCYDIAVQLGSGLINLELAPEVKEFSDLALKLVGIFSKNREEFLLLDYANVLYGNTMIPLYDTLGPESIPFILQQSGIVTLFASAQSIPSLLKASDLGRLKFVVTFDTLKEDLIKQVNDRGLKVINYNEVLEAGKKNPRDLANVQPQDIYTFSYTSGTTGNPKGAMLKHQNFCSTGATLVSSGFQMLPTDVHLSYLPLPHVMERIVTATIMGYGGLICMYGGDVMKIKDDLMLVKPTIFVSVPRLYQRLYSTIKDRLEKVSGVQKKIADQALSSKLYYLRSGGYTNHRLWDKLVFNKTKDAFGGRVRLMVTGSAPLSGDVINFLKVVVCCPMIEGYGQTESTGGSFITRPDDQESGHVGGPMNNIEFKVVDVPEMKYLSTDKDQNGNATPRGEICVRGWGVFAGYYKDEEKTKEIIDAEGWLHTGDIGLIRPNGSLKILDRVKNIFKLSQGEYVAPEKLENIYVKVKGVSECFVYGESTKSFTVAIIVPDAQEVQKVAEAAGIQGSHAELCQAPQVIQHFLTAMQAQGKQDKLNGIENIKKLDLEAQSFIVHGLMSNTLKLQRFKAKEHFQTQIAKMYEGAE